MVEGLLPNSISTTFSRHAREAALIGCANAAVPGAPTGIALACYRFGATSDRRGRVRQQALEKARWLAIVGTVVLVLGLYLSFVGLTRYYPGVVLIVGSLCWIAFLALNEPSWNRPEPDAGDEDASRAPGRS